MLPHRLYLPRRTVRLRLTLLYGSLFILSGIVLLALTNLWSVSIAPAGSQGIATPTETTRLGQAQARIQDLESQVTALQDHLQVLESHQLFVASAFSLAVMAVVSIGVGWLMAGRILRPLRAIATATQHISEDDLGRRLPAAGPEDELKELANTINELLSRLQTAFDAQRQFVANASHELRTPLTLERAMLEVALGDPDASAVALRSTCEGVLAANQEQERLIEALLTLARSQRGLDHREAVDLAETARKVIAACRPQAQGRGVSIQADLAAASFAGDPSLAERMVANLAENAIRYNVPGGRVVITVGTRNRRAFLAIANTGSEVPPDQVQRLLLPFQRLSPGRAGEAGGSGLGLSIVTAIAKAHDATISAASESGGGLRVEVSFATLTSDAPTPAGLAALPARRKRRTGRFRRRSADYGLPRKSRA